MMPQTSELQRALRRALERRALPPSTLLACESRAVRAKGELLTLPEADSGFAFIFVPSQVVKP